MQPQIKCRMPRQPVWLSALTALCLILLPSQAYAVAHMSSRGPGATAKRHPASACRTRKHIASRRARRRRLCPSHRPNSLSKRPVGRIPTPDRPAERPAVLSGVLPLTGIVEPTLPVRIVANSAEEPIESPPPLETPPAESLPLETPPTQTETQPVEPPPTETQPTEPPPAETTEVTGPTESGVARMFAGTSVWNEPVSASAPVDSGSESAVAALNSEELAEQAERHGPAINTKSWSVPIYTVPSDQPTVRVTLVGANAPALQSAWNAVPLPSDAKPAAGTDEHLVVWQPSADRMWEFWHLEKVGGAWRASWGGAMDDVASSSGTYSAEAWPGATSSWGASASSLPIAGGLITLEDLQHGVIDHALAISIPNVRAGVFASPAQRTDGESTASTALPEGAHLRLDPHLDLAALHLPRFTLMLATAAQKYGIVVRDRAANIAFYAQDPTPTGTEPYGGTTGYFEARAPASLLASFPWSHLELLKMALHVKS
jgi:hypothetical protein